MTYSLKSNFKRVLLISIMVLAAFTMIVFAAEESHARDIGSLNGRVYSDFDDLCDDLDDNYGGKTVVIEMLTNWDYNESHDFDQRLIIPKDCKATLNMNGNVFDRMLSINNDWEYNGELICVRPGSTLTINGGDTARRHDEPVYSSVNSGNKANTVVSFYGGTLTGGCSTGGGGGIHLGGSDITLTLNDVTLAGCRAECPWYDSAGTNSGYGGGIWITGGNTTVNLNNSTITGNHAQLDGGGIYASNKNEVKINLDNSHVDKNYSRSDGGGINLDGEKLTISGSNDSTVSGNVTNGYGGGIYLWNDEVTVSDLTISGNSARQGGGVYTMEETISLNSLVIKNNNASDKGGGIYIANDGNTINACDIQGNNKYGVYVEDDVDENFNINGSTVIKGNTGGNLTMQDGSSKVSFTPNRSTDIHIGYVKTQDIYQITPYFSSDVRKYLTPDNSDYIVTYDYSDSKDNGRADYLVRKDKWQSIDPSTDEPIPPKEPAERVMIKDAGPEIVARVNAGGEKADDGHYALIRGLLHREITDSGGDDGDNAFYYSDGYFYSDPYEYNDHIATSSWSLAFGGTYLRLGWSEKEAYKYKHTGARQFFADIGCPDQNIYVNDSNVSKPTTDSIGVIIGSKNLQRYNDAGELEDTGDILIPIAVRGGGYENEWTSNVTLGSGEDKGDPSRDSEAKGFSQAADKVIAALDYYIVKYSLEDELTEGKVKFWLSGHSRAGATANITSKRLIEKYACSDEPGKNNQVFSYPGEPPRGGTDKAEMLEDKTKYFCIHNMVNYGDVVPYVAPEHMGFKRYGVDHYIPGTAAGTFPPKSDEAISDWSDSQEVTIQGGIKKTVKMKTVEKPANKDDTETITITTYCDNVPLETKPDEDGAYSDGYNDYRARRPKMLEQLDAVDSEILFDDFFQPVGVSIVPPQYGYTGMYNGAFLGDFLEDFMGFFQQYGLKDRFFNRSRNGYAVNKLKIEDTTYTTIELAARNFMSSDSLSAIMNDPSKLQEQLSFNPFDSYSVIGVFDNVVGEWEELPESEKLKYMNSFWNIIKNSGALKSLPDDAVAKLEEDLPTVLNLVLNYLDGDWDVYPDSTQSNRYVGPSGKKWAKNEEWYNTTHFLMYTLTLYKHMGMIFRNHDPELNMAWTRTYDSYFDDDKKEYRVVWGELDGKTPDGDDYTVDAPKAYKAEDGMEQSSGSPDPDSVEELVPADEDADKDKNIFVGSKKILLEVGTIGDAVPGNGNVIGEAIYYDLYDVTKGENAGDASVIAEKQIYLGGIDLQAGEALESSRKYKIEAYARSYGVHSPVATYYVTVKTDKHSVTVFNSSDESESVEYQYREGEDVSLTATDRQDMQFSSWIITDSENNDVTSKLLENSETRTINFTMPEGGAEESDGYEWDEAYALTVKSQYYNKIKDITVSGLDQPVCGADMDGNATLSFNEIDSTHEREPVSLPVIWTYEGSDGISVQPDGKAAYRETVYTASITIPQDVEAKQIFTVQERIRAEFDGKAVSVTKNNADGSVTVRITFDETGSDDGEVRPEKADINLTVMAFDMNYGESGEYIHDYDTTFTDAVYNFSHGSSYTLTAPDIPGMLFESWDLDTENTGILTTDNLSKKAIKVTMPEAAQAEDEPEKLSVTAKYRAVVSEVHATLENAPAAGEALPGSEKAGLIVTILRGYEIAPDSVDLIWSPKTSKVNHMTVYTASVQLKPTADGIIYVRPEGTAGEFFPYNVNNIKYSDDLDVTFSVGEETAQDAPYDTANMSISKTFDPIKYTLKQVKSLDDIEGLANGSGESEVKAVLPETTKIILDDGTEMDVSISWDDPVKTSDSADPLDGSEWRATGTVTIPVDRVQNPDKVDLSVSIKVTVKEAAAALAPTATPEAGAYLADQVVTLKTNTKGGTTWYTIDGSDPKDSGNSSRKKYDGEDILVTKKEYPEGLTIRAYTEKSGMRDSAEAVFFYEFTTEVPVPEGKEITYSGEEQKGIISSQFYTLEPISDGVTIDKHGDAAAVNAGTYKVKAKLKPEYIDEYKWVTGKDDDGRSITTTEDQEVTFTILVADLAKSAYIQADDSCDTIDALIDSIKVINFSEKEVSTDDYDLFFEEKPLGMVLVTAVGKRNYKGFITKEIMYTPVVNEIKAEIDEPEIGKALPDTAKVTIRMADEYEVSPDCIEVIWSPADSKAEYDTEYTATIRIVPDASGHIKVRKAGDTGDYTVDIDAGNLAFAESLKAAVNGEAAEFDEERRTVSKTFDAIKEEKEPDPEPDDKKDEPEPDDDKKDDQKPDDDKKDEPAPDDDKKDDQKPDDKKDEPVPDDGKKDEPQHKHVWDSGKVTKKATDKVKGTITYTCRICGETKTESIAKVKLRRPRKMTFARAPKKLVVKWAKVKGATGYILQYRKHGEKKWKLRRTNRNRLVLTRMRKDGLYQIRVAAVKAETKYTEYVVGRFFRPAYKFYRGVKGLKIKAGRKSVKVSWKKARKAGGYIILVSEKKNMTKAKLVKISGRNRTKGKVRGLKSGKKYYVSVRPYRVKGGKFYKGIRHKSIKIKVK